MEDRSKPNVTYVGDVLTQLSEQLEELQRLVMKRVLPSSRGPLTTRLRDAHTKVQQVQELLDRAQMSKRLGFIEEGGQVQPVMAAAADPVNARG
jgi:hypothetical protein